MKYIRTHINEDFIDSYDDEVEDNSIENIENIAKSSALNYYLKKLQEDADQCHAIINASRITMKPYRDIYCEVEFSKSICKILDITEAFYLQLSSKFTYLGFTFINNLLGTFNSIKQQIDLIIKSLNHETICDVTICADRYGVEEQHIHYTLYRKIANLHSWGTQVRIWDIPEDKYHAITRAELLAVNDKNRGNISSLKDTLTMIQSYVIFSFAHFHEDLDIKFDRYAKMVNKAMSKKTLKKEEKDQLTHFIEFKDILYEYVNMYLDLYEQIQKTIKLC